MNGFNNHEINEGGHKQSVSPCSCWTIGLVNVDSKRYLTAETFGFKINANGASLKKKQLWTLEPTTNSLPSDGPTTAIRLRSHLDKYLAVDTFGNVTCDGDDPTDPGTVFHVFVTDGTTGSWALKNVVRGYYLGASSDNLKCTAKAAGPSELWLVHLAARPQVSTLALILCNFYFSLQYLLSKYII